MRAGTHREAPVDVRHLGVQVEAEDEEENPRHHAGAAADKLKEVDASAWRAHHDGLYADESNEGQHLEGEWGVGGVVGGRDSLVVGWSPKKHGRAVILKEETLRIQVPL